MGGDGRPPLVPAPGRPCRYSAAETRARCQAGPKEACYQQYRRHRLWQCQITLPIPGDGALRVPSAAKSAVRGYRAAGQAEKGAGRARKPTDVVIDGIDADADRRQIARRLRPGNIEIADRSAAAIGAGDSAGIARIACKCWGQRSRT